MLKYLLAFLLVSSLGLGATTYHLIGKLAEQEAKVTVWQEKANQNAKAAALLGESCKVTMLVLQATQEKLDALQQSRTSDLEALQAIPQITLPETHVNAPTKPTAPSKAADDLRLSPDVMRLLDNAYCSGAKGDNYCTTR